MEAELLMTNNDGSMASASGGVNTREAQSPTLQGKNSRSGQVVPCNDLVEGIVCERGLSAG
jgi:hypothetical protein